MIVSNWFNGMSCGSMALKELGIVPKKYFAAEIDKYANEFTRLLFPETILIGNVEKIDYKANTLITEEVDYKNVKIDLLMGGSPCQDLSGLKTDGKGLEGDKSRLLKDFVEFKNKAKPKYFLLENVVPKNKEWKKQIDELMGVEGIYINSDLFVQQNRPRIYWTNIPIAELPTRPDWEGEYFQYRRTYYRENKSGVCPCLTANMGTGGHNVPLKSMDKKDKLCVVECGELQGISKYYTDTALKAGISNSQMYKMIGNAWTVPVIKHILSGME